MRKTWDSINKFSFYLPKLLPIGFCPKMICQTKRGKLKGWPHVPIKTIFIIFSGEHSVRARKTRLQVDKWLWLFFSFLVIMVGRERIPLGFSVILVNVVCFGPAPIRKWCGLTLVIPSPSLFTLLIPNNDHNSLFILFYLRKIKKCKSEICILRRAASFLYHRIPHLSTYIE